MDSDLTHKAKVTMRTLCVSLLNNWKEEAELIEDVKWALRNKLRSHKELRRKVEEVETDENMH